MLGSLAEPGVPSALLRPHGDATSGKPPALPRLGTPTSPGPAGTQLRAARAPPLPAPPGDVWVPGRQPPPRCSPGPPPHWARPSRALPFCWARPRLHPLGTEPAPPPRCSPRPLPPYWAAPLGDPRLHPLGTEPAPPGAALPRGHERAHCSPARGAPLPPSVSRPSLSRQLPHPEAGPGPAGSRPACTVPRPPGPARDPAARSSLVAGCSHTPLHGSHGRSTAAVPRGTPSQCPSGTGWRTGAGLERVTLGLAPAST